MATYVTRKRLDGTPYITAQIRRKKDKKVVHSEGRSFPTMEQAKAWAAAREAKLKQPVASSRVDLALPAKIVIELYIYLSQDP